MSVYAAPGSSTWMSFDERRMIAESAADHPRSIDRHAGHRLNHRGAREIAIDLRERRARARARAETRDERTALAELREAVVIGVRPLVHQARRRGGIAKRERERRQRHARTRRVDEDAEARVLRDRGFEDDARVEVRPGDGRRAAVRRRHGLEPQAAFDRRAVAELDPIGAEHRARRLVPHGRAADIRIELPDARGLAVHELERALGGDELGMHDVVLERHAQRASRASTSTKGAA